MSDVRIDNVSRRDFLCASFSASAFVVGASVIPSSALANSGHVPRAEQVPFHPTVFVGIERDGTVIIIAHRSEMGSGIRTALPMVLADELGADWSRVQIEQAIGDGKYGDQNTDGSRSQTRFFDVMRQSGATARLMLEQAASARWGVPASECTTSNHTVTHVASNRSIGFGELAEAAAALPVPSKDSLRYKSPADYRYIGKGVPVAGLREMCTGEAVFGMDLHRDGMVYASVERCPVVGGRVGSVDDAAAMKVRGVRQIVRMEGGKRPFRYQPLGGVAVIADNTWAAFQGRKKLKIDWELGDNVAFSSREYKQSLHNTTHSSSKVIRNIGNVDKVFAATPKTRILEADYYVPHVAHAAMEPPVAVAEARDGKMYIWAPTQNPQAVQDTVASVLGIKKQDVICYVSLLGSGFGRKSMPDYCAEAAILATKLGKPVKLVWSREDDLQFDFYNSAAAMYFKGALDEQGNLTALLQRSAFPPIASTSTEGAVYGGAGELAQGFSDVPYIFKHHRVENGPAQAHLRIGWMRSVGNLYHTFGVSSFTDELAHAARRDPKDYLLELIGESRHINIKSEVPDYPNRGESLERYPLDTGRLRNVIELVAEKSGWAKRTLAKGRGMGIAVRRSFLTYVATVVEVAVDEKGKISIPRVDFAVDAGLVVHPERVIAQMEGAAVFGASFALHGEITATKGAVDQRNFHNYPVLRIHEAPRQTNVHLVKSDAPPSGIGEPGVSPFAAALCNAIFAATGTRIRELPIGKQKLWIDGRS